MDILETLIRLRDDVKTWVTNNVTALNSKVDEKTIPVDSELSSTSTNPVQNKAIANAINNIPKFSGSYNDLTDAPNISEDDCGNTKTFTSPLGQSITLSASKYEAFLFVDRFN